MGTLLLMKLSRYLIANRQTHAEFARAVGSSPFAVGKWVRGERIPRPKALARIFAETGGQVGPGDFFDNMPAAQAEAA